MFEDLIEKYSRTPGMGPKAAQAMREMNARIAELENGDATGVTLVGTIGQGVPHRVFPKLELGTKLYVAD